MEDTYTGVETLEALEEAVNYQRFLTGLLAETTSAMRGGGRVLDFGAGTGTYARHARALGFDVVCVEPDERLRRRLDGDGFETAPALEAVPDGSVAAVYSFNVLEHIVDDTAALRELHRVTVPGGRLLLYVPAFPILFSALDRQVGHVRRYTREGLVATATAAGFEVDRCVHADSLGFPSALVYRVLSRRSSGVLRPGPVRLYDRWVFPLSRRLDTVVERHVGKNLVLVAHRPTGRSLVDAAMPPGRR